MLENNSPDTSVHVKESEINPSGKERLIRENDTLIGFHHFNINSTYTDKIFYSASVHT